MSIGNVRKTKEYLAMKTVAFTGDIGFSSKYFRGTYSREDLLDERIIHYLCDADYAEIGRAHV